MGVLDDVRKLPPEVIKRIEENIEEAEFDDMRIGGTDGNPVVAEFVIMNTANHKQTVKIGRGRVFITWLSKQGDDIKVKYRFENHHRSRGWTLRTDLIFFNDDGDVVKTDYWKGGLSEKDFGSYKRREKKRTLAGLGKDTFGVLLVSYRDPSLRFKKPLQELGDKIKEEVIKEIVEEIKSWFGDDDDGDDGDDDETKAAKVAAMDARIAELVPVEDQEGEAE